MEPADDAGNSYMMYNYKNQADIKYVYLKGIRKAKKVTGATNGSVSSEAISRTATWGSRISPRAIINNLGDERIDFKRQIIRLLRHWKHSKTRRDKKRYGIRQKSDVSEKKTLLTLRLDYFDENKIKIKEMKLLSFLSRNNVNGQKVYFYTGTNWRNVKRGTKTELLFKNLKFEDEANIKPEYFFGGIYDT